MASLLWMARKKEPAWYVVFGQPFVRNALSPNELNFDVRHAAGGIVTGQARSGYAGCAQTLLCLKRSAAIPLYPVVEGGHRPCAGRTLRRSI